MSSDALTVAEEAHEAVRSARNSVRTRQILRAAARLMARDGSDAVSMQALADEASVSVGLIYRYFGNKQDLLHAVIAEVLDDLAARVPAAIEAAGADPVRRLAGGFRAYCEAIADHRHAALLTYRESKALGVEASERLKKRETATVLPLLHTVEQGVAEGVFAAGVHAELVALDLVMLAHAWALKHWYFEAHYDLDTYIARQTAIGLGALIVPERRADYPDLLDIR
ncbi:TetR/AcrR family transcriptional regulator [Microbacterium aurantiacum]|uniref:TetR/AcrR family transcriptional regulator n=1 Tax=Microbacterium aurantiacum TaxID=162393 RepID=UPI0034251150